MSEMGYRDRLVIGLVTVGAYLVVLSFLVSDQLEGSPGNLPLGRQIQILATVTLIAGALIGIVLTLGDRYAWKESLRDLGTSLYGGLFGGVVLGLLTGMAIRQFVPLEAVWFVVGPLYLGALMIIYLAANKVRMGGEWAVLRGLRASKPWNLPGSSTPPSGGELNVIDLRPEFEKQAELAANQRLGDEDERVAIDLVELIAKAPDQLYDEDGASEAERKIRAIGEMLCEQGGHERMVRIAYRVERLAKTMGYFPTVRLRRLELHWNEICDWLW